MSFKVGDRVKFNFCSNYAGELATVTAVIERFENLTYGEAQRLYKTCSPLVLKYAVRSRPFKRFVFQLDNRESDHVVITSEYSANRKCSIIETDCCEKKDEKMSDNKEKFFYFNHEKRF